MQLSGRIVTGDGVVAGSVRFGARVESVTPQPEADAAGDGWIVPGFVDLHVHGGGGGDAMGGEAGLRRAAAFHAAHGTTALLATTWTAPVEAIETALVGARAVIERPAPGEAAVLGAHLEGPWINPGRLGAQPPFARPPRRWELERLLELAPVRVLTVAPEIEDGMAWIGELAGRGVNVQIGHTEASAEVAWRALQAGASGFTHLYNAMTPFAHRDAGAAGAALAAADFAEIIVDLVHVEAPALLAAMRAIPGCYAVTDAIGCAGLGDGEYDFVGRRVVQRDGVVRMQDGTLAGSGLTMDRALRNLVRVGLSIPEAVRRTSTIASDYLGMGDRGRIAPGSRADLVVLDAQLQVQQVWIGGRQVAAASGSPGIAEDT